MSLVAWRLLRGGATTDRAVLCVDFTQSRVRAQAGFADLAAVLPDRFAVWGTDEGAWHDTASTWQDPPDRAVAGVFGYCAGAALACALADRVARMTGTAPPVVLFDPAVVTAQTLLEQFDAALHGLVGVAPEQDLAAARADAHTDAGTDADLADLDWLAAALTRRYGDLARPACAAQQVPEAIADQLCGRLEAYLRYLVRSAAVPLRSPGAATVVLSATFQPLPSLEQHPQVRTDATQAGLLADAAAAGAAARALTGEWAGEWLAAAP